MKKLQKDEITQLWTIVYDLPMTNAQLFGDIEHYMTSQPEQVEDITDFTEANDVIARIKGSL